MRGSIPPMCDVLEVKTVLEKVGFENKDPLYDNGRHNQDAARGNVWSPTDGSM